MRPETVSDSPVESHRKTAEPEDFYRRGAEDTLRLLSSRVSGLSAAEAAERRNRCGPNELRPPRRVSPFSLLAAQLSNVLILILAGGALASALVGHRTEAIAITLIVLFAVLLGFFQEYRAERAIEALRQMAAPNAVALRNGEPITIPARDLVAGDVMLLSPGDRVPADGRLLEQANLKVDEAALTGESAAVGKQTEALSAPDLPLGDRRNMVYGGTAVTYGRGRAVVVAIGMATEFGRIAAMLEEVHPGKTALELALDRVGKSLARAAFVLVAAIALFGLLRGQPLLEMFLFAIALAVAVVPEALPAVVTISLALGVQRMVKRHALVRRLPAVETLGSVSVILSDKTGTLTKDEMTVRRLYTAGVSVEFSGAGYEPTGELSVTEGTLPHAAVEATLRAAALVNDARLVMKENVAGIQGDPTEAALLVAAKKAGLDKQDLDRRFPRHDEIPFTSESRLMVTLHGESSAELADAPSLACAKGAPEVILDLCTHELTAEGPRPIDPPGRQRLLAVAHNFAGQALRVLAIAQKNTDELDPPVAGFTFLGLVGMIDPPRPEAAAAIRTCRRAGIVPVMITGDHRETAAAVAHELGLLEAGRPESTQVLTGAELDRMSDEQLAAEVHSVRVYARVSPAHKLRVVSAWQAQGVYVAMTGDGVNDAPALKKANIGIAMGIKGTEVSREAAAMTLTDDNFASIVAAVEEGRVVYGNIKKYLMYLLSANVGELGLMGLATLLGVPLPLTAVQILYVNLATDGLPALALAVDPPEPDLMSRPPRDAQATLFTRPVVALMLLGGFWLMVVIGGLFLWASHSGRSLAEARTMAFAALVLLEFGKAYCFRSDRLSLFVRPFANRWLNLAIS